MKTQLTKLAAVSTLGLAVSLATMPRAEAFTLAISPNNGSTENTGASALLDFNFVQSGNNTVLNLGIRNTTNGTQGLGATQATLVGVGFDLPDSVSVSSRNLGSVFQSFYTNAALNPYGTFDVGIRSSTGGTFAGGNPQGGLTAGQSTVSSFTFNNWNATSLENLFKTGFQNDSLRAVGRFQQVNAGGGSDKVLADFVPEVPVTNSGATPEPTTMVGMGLAGAMMGWQRRRQVRRQAERSA